MNYEKKNYSSSLFFCLEIALLQTLDLRAYFIM